MSAIILTKMSKLDSCALTDRESHCIISIVMPLKIDLICLCQKIIQMYQLIQSLKIYYHPNQIYQNFFSIHVAKILCKYMPFFIEDFSDVIPEHLEHPMSSQVSQKSDMVSIALHKINSYIATICKIMLKLNIIGPSRSVS